MQLVPFNQPFEQSSQGICAAIGVFDGVHKGHQSVIGQVLEDARQLNATPLVITFDKHPISILKPSLAPKMIYPLETKLSLLESYGVGAVMLIPFDAEIASLSASDFYKIISTNLNPLLSISMGLGFVFARNRTGNVEKLRQLTTDTQTTVHEIASVCCQEERISSTRIRTEISKGNFSLVSEMLGRKYSFISEVVVGDQIGRTLGFPTANLAVAGRAHPPRGVYVVDVIVEGKSYKGCLNVGLRPTLGCCNPETRVEVHILNFYNDIYGKTIEVIPLRKIRDEQKFKSLDQLRSQIVLDLKQVHEEEA